MPQRSGLLDGVIGAADQILLLALDPKMGRIVGQVREHRYVWRARAHGPQTLAQRAVKVWDKRDHQAGQADAPVSLQQG